MKRRSKIIATLVTLGLALSMVAIGVYSATLVSFGISGNISYKVEDVFCRINTQLYYSTDNVVLKYADAYNAGYDLSQAETLPSNIAKAPTTYFAGKEIKTYDNTTGQMITSSAEDLVISGIQLPLGSYDSTADSVKSYKYYIVIEVENYGQNDITVQVTDTTNSENATLLKNVQRDITNNNVVIPQNETKKVVIAVSIINLKENISSTEIDYSVLVQEKQENSLTTAVIDTIENGNTTQITTSFDSSMMNESINLKKETIEGLPAAKLNLTLMNIPNEANSISFGINHSLQTMVMGLYEHNDGTPSEVYNTMIGYFGNGQEEMVSQDGIFDASKKNENNSLEICLLVIFNGEIAEEIVSVNISATILSSSESKVTYRFVGNSYAVYADRFYFESNEDIMIEEGDIKTYIVSGDKKAYNVTTIGEYAFSNYTQLKGIYFPDTITHIGFDALSSSGITGILTLPQNLETIDIQAFDACTGIIGELVLPDTLRSIGDSAFEGCTGIKNIKWSKNLTKVSPWAFANCIGLEGLVLTDNIQEIHDHAFYRCTGLKSVNFSNNIKSIGISAFDGCSGLVGELTLPRNLILVDDYAFTGCSGITGGLEIPTQVEKIGEDAFSDCNILSLVIPDSVSYIGDRAFFSCNNLANITIGSGVNEIGMSAFDGTAYYDDQNNWTDSVLYLNSTYENITYLVKGKGSAKGDFILPASVKTVANAALNLTDFNSIVVDENNLNFTSKIDGQETNSVIKIGANNIRTFVTGNENSILIEGITKIGVCGFFGFDIEQMVMPSSVNEICERAFEGCTLVSIDLKNVQIIGDRAFNYSGLTSIDLDNVINIGEMAFNNCTALTNIFIPDSVTEIGGFAFYNWTAEQSIYFEGTSMPENLNESWNDGCNAKIYLNGVLQN